jgi:hypothetical protein
MNCPTVVLDRFALKTTTLSTKPPCVLVPIRKQLAALVLAAVSDGFRIGS